MFAVVNYTCPGDNSATVRIVSITPEQAEDYNWTNSCTDFCPIGVYNNFVYAEKMAEAVRRLTKRRINQNGGYY